MNDIQPGDVVVCVFSEGRAASRTAPGNISPKVNHFYRVHGVVLWLGEAGLILEGQHRSHHPTGAWRARCFRKIEAPRTEISDRIRKCRPIRIGVDA